MKAELSEMEAREGALRVELSEREEKDGALQGELAEIRAKLEAVRMTRQLIRGPPQVCMCAQCFDTHHLFLVLVDSCGE